MRVKRGIVTHRRHKRILKSVKGFRMSKHRLIKVAKEAQFHAGQYAYVGRRKKKGMMRQTWIRTISSFVSQSGISYSVFVNRLKKAHIELDRKILAYLIKEDREAFQAILDKVK